MKLVYCLILFIVVINLKANAQGIFYDPKMECKKINIVLADVYSIVDKSNYLHNETLPSTRFLVTTNSVISDTSCNKIQDIDSYKLDDIFFETISVGKKTELFKHYIKYYNLPDSLFYTKSHIVTKRQKITRNRIIEQNIKCDSIYVPKLFTDSIIRNATIFLKKGRIKKVEIKNVYPVLELPEEEILYKYGKAGALLEKNHIHKNVSGIFLTVKTKFLYTHGPQSTIVEVYVDTVTNTSAGERRLNKVIYHCDDSVKIICYKSGYITEELNYKKTDNTISYDSTVYFNQSSKVITSVRYEFKYQFPEGLFVYKYICVDNGAITESFSVSGRHTISSKNIEYIDFSHHVFRKNFQYFTDCKRFIISGAQALYTN